MNSIGVLAIILTTVTLSFDVFAATKTSKTTTTSAVTQTEVVNKTSVSNTANYQAKTNPQMYFSTNMLGLINGNSNVNANFFVLPKIALSVSFSNDAEKTAPLKKANQAANTKLTVSTTQFGVGAAYYFFPMEQKWNISANPYLVSEKKSDPLDTENNLGFGLKAEGLYLINSLALGGGLQAVSVSGNTTTIASGSVGYLF